MGIAAGIFGAGLILFSLSRFLALSLVLMMVTGFGMIVQMAATNTILQTIVDDDKRGRVMSLYVMALVGITPFGSLLAGGLANNIGAPYTVLIGGACCIIASTFFFIKFKNLNYATRDIESNNKDLV